MTTIKNLLLTGLVGLTLASCAKDDDYGATTLHEVTTQLVDTSIDLAQQLVKIGELEAKIAELEAQAEVDAATIAQLTLDLEILTNDYNELSDYASLLEIQIDELTILLDEKNDIIISLTQANEDLAFENDSLKALIDQKDALIGAQQSEIDDLNSKILTQESVINELNTQIAYLTDTLNSYEVQVVNSTDDLTAANDRIAELTEALENGADPVDTTELKLEILRGFAEAAQYTSDDAYTPSQWIDYLYLKIGNVDDLFDTVEGDFARLFRNATDFVAAREAAAAAEVRVNNLLAQLNTANAEIDELNAVYTTGTGVVTGTFTEVDLDLDVNDDTDKSDSGNWTRTDDITYRNDVEFSRVKGIVSYDVTNDINDNTTQIGVSFFIGANEFNFTKKSGARYYYTFSNSKGNHSFWIQPDFGGAKFYVYGPSASGLVRGGFDTIDAFIAANN